MVEGGRRRELVAALANAAYTPAGFLGRSEAGESGPADPAAWDYNRNAVTSSWLTAGEESTEPAGRHGLEQ